MAVLIYHGVALLLSGRNTETIGSNLFVAGGVGLYIHNVYAWKKRDNLVLDGPDFECIFVELTEPSVIIGCIYIWYSEEGPERAAAPPSPLLVYQMLQPTHQRPVYLFHIFRCGMWHYNYLCQLTG